MDPVVVINLRPVSLIRDYQLQSVVVHLHDGNFNRAVKKAKGSLVRLYPKGSIERFDVVSIKVV